MLKAILLIATIVAILLGVEYYVLPFIRSTPPHVFILTGWSFGSWLIWHLFQKCFQ